MHDHRGDVLAVNVRGLFQVTRAAMPLLRNAPKAAVVNTASIVGLRPGPQPVPVRGAARPPSSTLTKTLAGHLGPEGIRVNAVAPGWMEGDWMKRMLGDKYEDAAWARRAKLTPLAPLRHRRRRRRDASSACIQRRRRFVTGEIVVIDGGFTATT